MYSIRTWQTSCIQVRIFLVMFVLVLQVLACLWTMDFPMKSECASMHEPNKPWNIKTITHTSLTGWCPERYVCWFMFIQLTDNKVILKIQRATIVTAPLFSLVHIPYYTPFSSDISQQLLLWHTKEKLLGHLPRNPHWIPTKSHPWKSP